MLVGTVSQLVRNWRTVLKLKSVSGNAVSTSTCIGPEPGTTISSTSCGAQRSSGSVLPHATPRSRGRVAVIEVSNITDSVAPMVGSTRVMSVQLSGGPAS